MKRFEIGLVLLLCFLTSFSDGQIDHSKIQGNWTWKKDGNILRCRKIPRDSFQRPFLRFHSDSSLLGFLPHSFCGITPKRKRYILGDGYWSINDSSRLVLDFQAVNFSVEARYELLKLTNRRMILRQTSQTEKEKDNSYSIVQILERYERLDALNQLDYYLGEKSASGKKMDSLTRCERTCVFVFDLIEEVDNNGFLGYYMSAKGSFAMEAYHTLTEIGAIQGADILKRANDVWPSEVVEKDAAERRRILLEMNRESRDVWSLCQDGFLAERENVLELLLVYVIANQQSFH